MGRETILKCVILMCIQEGDLMFIEKGLTKGQEGVRWAHTRKRKQMNNDRTAKVVACLS